ncbi:uncharacterized protein BJ212DRAFT_1305207 [Suillus subaureus]|uniref:Uncharacterized protein n=1 Tax=Suillus subaureus TaxID=48587 RepID=A0A9P7DQJ8_9AGAM|nr:uncharacterized protein BJ212DRAFT_1305207 [Suillus subaureus]KAG1800694.1 hypothetical protein BJ212DRAFT_1305207 [Suillus subaureus]
MDVDESFVSQISLDSVSFGSLDVWAAIPSIPINPDLYLGPEDDIIDVDELPDSANPEIDAPAASEVSMLYETSTELHSQQPELANEDLCLMVQEFQLFGSYEHTRDLPDPSIPLLLEAE